MGDQLGFLFDVLGPWPAGFRAASMTLSPDALHRWATLQGVPVASFEPDEVTPEETDAAEWIFATLQGSLTRALVGDEEAGREELNVLLDQWQARFTLEVVVGPDELPGIEVEVTSIPTAPPPALAIARDGIEAPRVSLDESSLRALITDVAGALLTEAVNLHASGYADRVRACGSPACGRPFLDTTKRGDRRWCCSRCRARESAKLSRRGARAAPGGRGATGSG